MANWMPDTSKLSSDRWDVRQINNIDIECHLVNHTMDDISLPPTPKEKEPEPTMTIMSTSDEEEQHKTNDPDDNDSDCFIWNNRLTVADKNVFGLWTSDHSDFMNFP